MGGFCDLKTVTGNGIRGKVRSIVATFYSVIHRTFRLGPGAIFNELGECRPVAIFNELGECRPVAIFSELSAGQWPFLMSWVSAGQGPFSVS